MKTLANRARDARGQALVEFSIAILVFLVIVMAIFDLGRAIYMMNGTAQAAREIARAVSVHPCSSNLLACSELGTSTDAIDVIATQQGLVPGLTVGATAETQDVVNGIACVDATDAAIADINCRPRDFIRVSVIAPFTPITPLVSMFGTHNFTSTSRIEKP
jgi:Flp pilus assembly protein TadG